MVEKLPSQENNNQDIELRYGDTQAFVSLDGAYVTAFKVGGKDIFYPDGMIKINGQEKRRGGIPILFPWAGFLKDYLQHGFARDMKWEEVSTGDELVSSKVLLKLEANDKTKEIFPYNFEINLEVSLKENSLFYKLNVLNNDNKDMPVAPGFHPYFRVPEDRFKDIETNIKDFNPENYKLTETLFFPLKDLKVSIPEVGNLKIEYEDAFERKQSKLAVWTDKLDSEGDSYICFEPWVTDLGGFLKKDQQLLIPSGKEVAFTMLLTLS